MIVFLLDTSLFRGVAFSIAFKFHWFICIASWSHFIAEGSCRIQLLFRSSCFVMLFFGVAFVGGILFFLLWAMLREGWHDCVSCKAPGHCMLLLCHDASGAWVQSFAFLEKVLVKRRRWRTVNEVWSSALLFSHQLSVSLPFWMWLVEPF